MKASLRASALLTVVAAGAAVVVPLALPASAAPAPSVSCAKVNAPPLKPGAKLASTLSVCTPAALSAGGSSLTAVKPGQLKGTLTETITWKNGKGTTVAIVKYAGAKTPGKCSTIKGTSRVTITGSVKSATGAAAKITKAGEPLSGSVCAITTGTKQGQTVIEPGTKFKL